MASYMQSPMRPQLDLKEISKKFTDNLMEDNESRQFFSSLSTKRSDDALVKQVYQYLVRYQLMPKKPTASKSDHLSQESKVEGDEHFINKKYEKAVISYNNAIKFSTMETISIAYANRSAALYRLKKYHESLLDIRRAIEAGYDEKLMPELLSREKQSKEAVENTRAAKTAAAEDKREQLRQELYSLPENRMAGVSCASASIEISYSEFMGRSVTATEDIQPGQVLVVEDPYVSVLSNEHLDFRCYFCCSFNYAMIPCKTCTYAMYCNEECRTDSWNHGHKFECSIMSRLREMSFNMFALSSLSILLKAKFQHSSWEKLFETVDLVKKQTNPKLKGFTLDTNGDLSYDANHYAPIYMVETNADKWEQLEIYKGCVLSALILYMLKEYTTFFSDRSNVSEDDHFWRAGGLLFHHYMSVQMSAYGIEMYLKNKQNTGLYPGQIATGMYAFSSLFNHSCFPNSNSVFRGTKIIIYACRPIKKGRHVCISYGPVVYNNILLTERNFMLDMYKFKCKCEACINNWPEILVPARSVWKKNKKLFRNLLNSCSLTNLLKNYDNINLNFIKQVYKYTAMLEECHPCIELVIHLDYILSVSYLLGNFDPSENNFYANLNKEK